jgi:tetratricopeptide (TPR) repeat protein
VASALPEASPSVSLVADARAEAWASLANARRVTGDLVAAEEAWREADTFLAEGTGEPLLEARFCALKGSLRLAQRRTAEAIRLFRSACRLYRRVGDPHLAARTLISLGQAYEQAGRLGAAIRAACQGGRQLDPGREPELRLAAVHNLIHYLGEAGYPREALSLLREAAPLYRIHGGQMIALRMRWVESRLSRSLGNEVEALAELEEVRREFAARGMAFDAAQVALELAAAHAAAGRHEEVERLASELYPVFLSRGIPDEALVTLSLFLQAVERREATAEWVSGLALRLAELGPPHLR